MKRTLIICVAAVLVIGGLGLVAFWPGAEPGVRADPEDTAQVATGATLYQAKCASCHGADLEGQPDWQSPLASGGYPAPPHDETGHTWHHPDGLLFEITKHGGQAVAPANFQSNMPAFAAEMADDEIWAVLAFIKSQWPADVRARQDAISRQAQ